MQYTPREPFPTAPDPDDTPVGIVALWRLLWRDKLRILGPAVLVSLVTAVLVLRSDDIYSAEAQVLLTRGNLEVIEFDSAGGFVVTPAAIANALTIFASRTLAQQVVERLDLTSDPAVNPNIALIEAGDTAELYSDAAVRQLALDWLGGVTQITVLPGTAVIVIRAVTTDPDTSAAVANAYAEAYLDYQRSLSRSETERAAQALEMRVGALRLQLEQDQLALQDYRGNAQGATTENPEAMAAEAVNIRLRLETLESSLAALEDAQAGLGAVPEMDPDALRRLIDGSETLTRIARTALGRAVADASLAQDVAALRDAVGAERARLLRVRDAMRQGRDGVQTRIEEFNAYTIGLRQLEVELETTSQVYEAALARLKELAIQTGLRDAGAQILARAEAPLRAAAQGRRRMVAIAGFLGLFLGMAWVLLREAANNRVRRPSDLADLPGLGPVIQIPASAQGRKLRRGTPAKEMTRQSVSPFFEGVRTLRQRLLTMAAPQSGALVIGVFSALPNGARSSVTDVLAHSFAVIGRRVIVVDGDMRRGALSRSHGIDRAAPGLDAVIADNLDPADAIVSLEGLGFDLLPSGATGANPADLLESPRFAELVVALRDRYDVVLFDTPPILVVPDARRIAAQLGRHIFVAEYDRSPKPAVRAALAALQDAGGDRPILALCNVPGVFAGGAGVPG